MLPSDFCKHHKQAFMKTIPMFTEAETDLYKTGEPLEEFEYIEWLLCLKDNLGGSPNIRGTYSDKNTSISHSHFL